MLNEIMARNSSVNEMFQPLINQISRPSKITLALECLETKEDFIIGEEQSRRKEELNNLGWEILDLLPPKRANELQKELINEILENGWDK